MSIDFMEIAVRAEQKAYRELLDRTIGNVSDEDIIMEVCSSQEFMFDYCERELARSRSHGHLLGDLLA